MKKQTISFLLSLVLLLSLLPPLTAGADPWESGSAGNQVTWALDKGEGILSFEGTGPIYDARTLDNPFNLLWWDDGDSIREIRFGSGITGIGAGAFDAAEYASSSSMFRLRNVRSIRIPAGVSWIGRNAFFNCSRLDEIAVLNPDCLIESGPRTLGDPARTVVVGYPDSTARQYADEYGYAFRAIGCEDGAHVYQDTVVTPQTCAQDGLMNSECVVCGYKTQRPIPAGHNYVLSERLARTAYTCTRCGDSYVAGECFPLKLDEVAEFTVEADAFPCVSFTPERTECYRFQVNQYGAEDAYGYSNWQGRIYSADGTLVTEYSYEVVLEAGETYYCCYPQAYDDALPVRALVETEHDYVLTETTATCTEAGMGTYTCVYCGETHTEFSWPLGHLYEEEILEEPSCTREGLARYTCSRCGYSYTETLPVRHNYYYDVELPWYRHARCTICGEEYTFGTPDPPALELDKTVTAQFDKDDKCCFKYSPRTAERYSLTTDVEYGINAEVYDADGHWVNYNFYTDPIAVSPVLYAGQTYYFVLSRYNESIESFSATLEVKHDYRYEITTAPSCTSEGVMTATCLFCGDTYEEVLPAEHEWRYDVDLPWYRHAICVICGAEQDFGTKTPPLLTPGEEVQPTLNEDFMACYRFTPEITDLYSLSFTDPYFYDASITAYAADGSRIGWPDSSISLVLDAGQTYYFCLNSFSGQSSLPSLLLEQIHSVWFHEIEPPTCTQDGYSEGVCDFCGETITAILSASHQYFFDIDLPWYRHAVCQRCGEVYEEGDRLPPEIVPGEAEDIHIAEGGRKNYFRFTPKENGRYAIMASGDEDARCIVYNARGDYLWDFGDEDNLYNYGTYCTLHAGWTYYFALGFMNPNIRGDYSATLRLIEPLDEPELRLNERMLVQMSPDSPQRYFSFTPETDGYYSFYSDFIDGSNYPSAVLYDESGEAMFRWGSNYLGFELHAELKAGHPYHLAVSLTDSVDNASFYVAVKPLDSLFKCTELTLDKPETANVPPNNLHEVFRFIPEESGHYRFSSDSGEDTCCWLLDENLSYLGYNDDSVLGLDFRLDCYLDAGQTYYFEPAFRNIGPGGSFPVILERVVPEGDVIRPGETKTVFISEPQGEARLLFTPEQTDLYAFFSSAEYDTYALLLDEAGNPIADDDDSGDDSNFWLELPLEGGKPYQFAVHLYNSQATGSFQVSLQQVHSFNVYEAAPTCTEAGGTVYTCEFCGERHTEDAIPALGHSFGEWTVKKAAVCAEAGEESRVCTRCGAEETRAIAAPGHEWGEATYVWSEDNDQVTATRVCGRDAAHTETETVRTASRVTKEATDDAEGEQILTAAFQNRAFAEQSKTVPIPKTDKPDPKPQATFTDMPAEGHWAHDAIAWAVEQGVTTGTSDTTFSPNSGCTRAQVVTFLWRAANQPEPSSTENPFTDVKSSAYYYKAVLWAVEQGITKGTSESKFSPDAVCTRAQIVTFLWRYEGSREPGKKAAFKDVPAGAYYEKAVSWAAEQNITTGTSDTTFSPDSTCTRAQVVTFLYRDIVQNAD